MREIERMKRDREDGDGEDLNPNVLASETDKIKSWNHIMENIHNIVKVKVPITYFTVSQYMSSGSHKSIHAASTDEYNSNPPILISKEVILH
ncbi:hypothetical protein L195_g002052 [Trifolium pratense]|uniref:Uncharacterized protein n=1 Tax=Trifolium pratense TaxID=57577 RepID=A0A2K3NRD1_TRIPR|nr:hypothetical protein L195_g002052 [Trifolium pratense]